MFCFFIFTFKNKELRIFINLFFQIIINFDGGLEICKKRSKEPILRLFNHKILRLDLSSYIEITRLPFFDFISLEKSCKLLLSSEFRVSKNCLSFLCFLFLFLNFLLLLLNLNLFLSICEVQLEIFHWNGRSFNPRMCRYLLNSVTLRWIISKHSI